MNRQQRLNLLSAAVAAMAGTVATPTLARDWPVGFSKCADERETCVVKDGARQVSYGIKNVWVIKTLAQGNRACTDATFGTDPVPALTK